ncbi:MAG: LamG domain-containing protein [Thermosphaera sp.]
MPLQASRVLKTFKYAMYFDGVDDYVRTASQIALSTPLTVVAWFNHIDKFNSLTLVANAKTGSQSLGFRFYINSWPTMDRRLIIEIGTGTSGSGVYAPANTVQPGVWNHGVAVMSGSSSSLWLNGQKIRSGSLFDFTKTDYIYIGAMVDLYYLSGYIAQVLIYSRALSDSEISYNYLYPDNPIRDGLVLWLRADPNNVKDIDNDGINEWIDLSGYNNHGKIYGASLVQVVKPASRILPKARILNKLR